METSAELVRSSDFWFEDGTIILRVENTLYRVYRGLLSARSTVFHDTFSMPQPRAMEEQNDKGLSIPENQLEIEGFSVVQLHDKEKDFTYKTAPVSGLAELASVLRLSDKYDVAVLRDSMISILCDLYPSSLTKWLTREGTISNGYVIKRLDDITVLNLARQFDIRRILPGAMYQATKKHGFSLLYGVPGKSYAMIKHPDDRKRCVLGIPKLMLARRRVWSGYLVREVGGCRGEGGECDAVRLRWLAHDLSSEVDEDPLDDEIPWEEFEVCSVCLEVAKESYRKAREELWDDLPGIFDLGTWDELST
ncbi:hypothetical protein B0H13DRAFT_1587568 [Mycena leptocephala]|nr:hypothetical protein B0H13DRAFT_1587568 [Mycena leptocephala]